MPSRSGALLSRRTILKVSVAVCASTWLSGCKDIYADLDVIKPALQLTPEQQRYEESRQRMRQKFEGLGAELQVDGTYEKQFLGVTFYPAGSDRSFFESGGVGGPGGEPYSRGAITSLSEIPERARIVWRDSAQQIWDKDRDNKYLIPAGKIIGDEIVEVGSRIPQAAVAQIKNLDRAGLGVKFRMGNQGTLFGWHVARRQIIGNDYKKNNIDLDMPIQVGLVYSMAGGDFREAEFHNGKVVRKGWYIDKKTGLKIETDY